MQFHINAIGIRCQSHCPRLPVFHPFSLRKRKGIEGEEVAAKKLKVQEIDEVGGTFLVFFFGPKGRNCIGLKPDPSRKGETCHFLDG